MHFNRDFTPAGIGSSRPRTSRRRLPAILLLITAICAGAGGRCLPAPACASTDITCNPTAFLLYQNRCEGEIQVVFRSNRDGNDEIYAGPPGDFRRLTDQATTDSQPEWTAGGAGIVFMSQRDGNNEIYSMNADGSNVLRLINLPALDITPAPSLLTGRILFTSSRDGNREIYVMDADGGNQTRLTNDAGDDNTPVWAQNDTKILFASDRSGNDEIYSMNADGTGLTQLTNDPGTDRAPKWSAPRGQILFSSDRSGQNLIYAMNLDTGGEVTALTDFASDQPAPAPCDRRLLVRSSADVDGLNPDLDDEVFLVDPDAGTRENLSNDPGTDAQPDWHGT